MKNKSNQQGQPAGHLKQQRTAPFGPLDQRVFPSLFAWIIAVPWVAETEALRVHLINI